MKRLFLLLGCLFSIPLFAQHINVLHYNFFIDINDDNDSLKGLATIKFINPSGASGISFDLTNVQASGKGMHVSEVKDLSNGVQQLSFAQMSQKLLIQLPASRKGDTSTITVAYKGIPTDGLIISKNKFGTRTFFADNWPNRAHHWIPCNDRPDDKASFEFSVVAPSYYGVIANGVKLEEKELNNKKLTHWREETALPTKVMVIGVARFATKQFENSPNSLPVSAWVYPQDSTKGFYDFAVAPDIVQYFSGYIAPFPYQKLANVQSTTIFGGMENASCIFYAEDLVTGDRKAEDVVAHEIAHQWFGDMASEKSFAHLWLSEGFATYFTDLYFEHKYGKEAANKRLQKEREQVIRFATSTNHAVVDSTDNLMSLLNANSYQKGAWVLHMLRAEAGDSMFRKIIQTYYNTYKGSNAETRDFEKIVAQVTGKDWGWFFDQWLYRPGVPVLAMETKVEDGQFYLYVHQKGRPYRFHLDVDIIAKDGTFISRQLEVSEKESVFKVPIHGTSAQFTIDPHTNLLYELQD